MKGQERKSEYNPNSLSLKNNSTIELGTQSDHVYLDSSIDDCSESIKN